MTNIARPVNNNDVMRIASLALLPPLRRCLACIHSVVMSLATFPFLHPLSLVQRFLACVPHVVRSLAPLPCLPSNVACWQ